MHQQLADYQVFWREFRRTFQTTGAVLPSGRALSRALTRYVRVGGAASNVGDLVRERRILEVGPGTGAVTSHILCSMRSTDRLTLVERNDQFVARLRQRIAEDDSFQSIAGPVELIHASVEELPENEPYDIIVSGLPLNNFPVELVRQIAAKLRRLLAPRGVLSFFEYVAVRKVKSLASQDDERERLTGIGRLLDNILKNNEIKCDLVLTNIPPAWVHHVRNGDWRLETGEAHKRE
jgi:phosphatidylethanolamine/phosphatidyl-N-methylethanolamine N-methyltransferase